MKRSVIFALACSICLPAERAYALSDQWYVGIGGGASWLEPNPVDTSLVVSESEGTGGHVFFGRDLDDRSSGQLTFYSLGEALLGNDEVVPFNAVDASVLYRIYDSKDARLSTTGMSLALYGRFGLGYLDRDTTIPLNNDAEVYFGAGGGAEVFFTKNLSLRLEGMYHDRDAASASLQFVARFGGSGRSKLRPSAPAIPELPQTAQLPPSVPAIPELPQTAQLPPSVPAIPELPQTAQLPPSIPPIPTAPAAPTVASSAPAQSSLPRSIDADGDGVLDTQDQCNETLAGYPVRANGCALFDGVLSGVVFVTGTATFQAGSTSQLDFLANVLTQYPQARVELHTHTDNQGSVKDQAILTRARLRTIGTYLVGKGVKSNRLVLRSFGGTRPLYDNASVAGQTSNNRTEVIEHRSQ